MRDLSLPSVVEALIFASDTPLAKGRIASIIGTIETDDVVRIVDELNRGYELGRKPLKIVELAGGYQIVTREEYAPWIRTLFSPRRKLKLSQAALETIAIIAYKQPVARIEIERIRGVNVDGVLKNLLERNLIRIIGRDKGIGRPYLFGTTNEFLSHFGLKKISDLPEYESVRKGITSLRNQRSVIIESLEEKTEIEEDDESGEEGIDKAVQVHLPGRNGIEEKSRDDDRGGES
ncbi:MAG: SMC-Scp complex subunit ScpB [Candidatus Glassbacteria bacterium]